MNYNEEEKPVLEEDKILDEVEETEEDEIIDFEDDDDTFDDEEITVSDSPEGEEKNKDEVVEPVVSKEVELLEPEEEIEDVEEPAPSMPKKASKVLSYEDFIKKM